METWIGFSSLLWSGLHLGAIALFPTCFIVFCRFQFLFMTSGLKIFITAFSPFSFPFSPVKKTSRDLTTGGLRKRASYSWTSLPSLRISRIFWDLQNDLIVTVVTWLSLRGHNHSRIWAGFPDSVLQCCVWWRKVTVAGTIQWIGLFISMDAWILDVFENGVNYLYTLTFQLRASDISDETISHVFFKC